MRLLAMLLALFAALPAAAGGLKVVATVPDLAAIASEIGGEHVEVTAMALSTQDPHFVDARPNLALALSRADLLLLVGLQLEVGWLPPLLTGARNGDIQPGARGYLDCSQFVSLLQVPTGQVDRSMGDVHPGGNPHYLYDPRNAILVAEGVAARLSELDPENANVYDHNAAHFAEHLSQSISRWEAQLAGLRGQPVIEFHRSLVYLEEWLGFEVVADIEPKPGVAPTPAHIVQVISAGRQHDVSLVFKESFYPDTTAALVAEKLGARLVNMPGGAAYESGQSYEARFDALADSLVAVIQ
jgi:zinc/manganese transport system substrate-binding protein